MAAHDVDWLTLEESSFDVTRFTWAWIVALGTYGVGDIVTTISIVWFSPWYTEANPVIRFAIETFGGGGFLALKLVVIYGCIGISVWGGVSEDDPLLFYGPPVVLTIFGLYTTAFNLALLLW